jgi:hypothetical protein
MFIANTLKRSADFSIDPYKERAYNVCMQDEIIKFADISCEEVFACERFQAEYNNYLDELSYEFIEEQSD